jgi:hypothetical protein
MRAALRIELRRNSLLILLPVSAFLIWFAINQKYDPVALWIDRSSAIQGSLQALGPFVTGAAAWTASREHRRTMTDLLASTPRNPWTRTLTTAAATCGWAVAFYLAATAVVFALTAGQATWGEPVIWPVLSGLTAVIACAALGHAAGRLLPSLFTTPLIAIAVYALMAIGMGAALNHSTLGMLSPIYGSIGLDASVFYQVRPDLALVQTGCYLGLTLAAIGLSARPDPRRVREAAARLPLATAALGLALTMTTLVLAGTSRVTDQTGNIAVLGGSRSDHRVGYTPDCADGETLRVCVHPAYAKDLPTLAAVINTIAAPLTGTPGLPQRAEQVPDREKAPQVQGDPAVLTIPDFIIHGGPASAHDGAGFRTRLALALVTAPGAAPRQATPAQRAVALYLLQQAGQTSDSAIASADPNITGAVRRLAAFPEATRHHWIATHITALRAHALTVKDLP